MARKKLTLLMTVGTGIGVSGNHDMANRLSTSILHIRPDFIIFFVTEQSKENINFIYDYIKDDYDSFEEGVDYKLVFINDIDDFNECFRIYSDELYRIYNKDKVFVDYTSGTRTMTAAIACAGMFYNCNLLTVSGYRSEGIIKKGTELVRSQNLYTVKDEILYPIICNFFDDCRFIPAIKFINLLIAPDFNKDDMTNIFKAYDYLDNVNFNEAYSLLKDIPLDNEYLESIELGVKSNIKYLGMICNSHHENLKNCYILASLINNARRRAEEHKFDDAIARLYRSFELIAQIKLNQYGIITSNVDLSLLKEHNISDTFLEQLETYKDEGKIRIGLVMDYNLLNELGDPLGKYFVENSKHIINITSKRNNSILAHGLESQSEENYQIFEELVITLAKKLDKDMNRFLKETKFPRFELDVLNKDNK